MPQATQTTDPDVLGIKIGTLANYNLLNDIDPDTLYFIKDVGLIFRGSTLITPVSVVTSSISGHGQGQHAQITMTYYSGSGSPTNPNVVLIDVYTKDAIDAIITSIRTLINNHIAVAATLTRLGHVKLSDATDDTVHDEHYGETNEDSFAATPKAVAAALQAANEYTDLKISEAMQSVHQKGTYGLLADGADETRPLNEIPAEEGDTYICISTINDAAYMDANGDAATYDLTPADNILCLQDAVVTNGEVTTPARWTIVPNMSQNAVITENASTVLDENTFVLGAGQKKVKKLPAGTTGQMICQGNNGPQWITHVNADHGIGYGVCETAHGDSAKTVPFTGFKLVEGATVAVLFKHGVAGHDTLNVASSGNVPIVYQNEFIADNIITKNDTATLMYTNKFVFLSEPSERVGAWVVISVDKLHDMPTQLSGFTNNIQGIGTCNTASGNQNKTVTMTGIIIGKGSVFAVTFTQDVDSGSTLNINSSGAKYMLHRGLALGANQIRANDTVTFISDGSSYHVLSIDRPFDAVPTENSHSLVDSDAVYQAIESAKLKWSEF